MVNLQINGKAISADVSADTPLLWVIREHANMTGTKFGCGIGMCGACTVHIEGRATRSCITPVRLVAGAKITTIKGLALTPQQPHPLQKAWVECQVPQCGYCQSGQIMQAAAMLKDIPAPTDEDINGVMRGNLCRCMAYVRIRRAIKMAAAEMSVTAVVPVQEAKHV